MGVFGKAVTPNLERDPTAKSPPLSTWQHQPLDHDKHWMGGGVPLKDAAGQIIGLSAEPN